MDHVVYVDAKAKELEGLIAGTNRQGVFTKGISLHAPGTSAFAKLL